MFKQLRPALASLLVLSLVTGVAYPLLVTGIAQLAFPSRPMAACCATPRARCSARG